MALTDNLVAFWKLDEASGTRNDSVGSNHLTDNNTVLSVAGQIGNAAQFVAANSEFLSIASNADVQSGDIDYTLAGWVYIDSGSDAAIVTKDHSVSGTREYFLGTSGNKFLFHNAKPTDSLTLVFANTFGTLSAATWYFVVAYHDAAADEIGISVNNGAFDTAATGGALQAASTAEFRIGARQYSGFEGYFNGRVDAVGYWKRKLSAGDVTELWNGGSGFEWPFTTAIPSGFQINSLRPRIFAPGTSR